MPELIYRDALPRPQSFDQANRTIEAVIATNSPVARRGYQEILDIAGADLSAIRGAPVLDSHRQDGLNRVLGTVEDARTEGDQIIGRIRFSARPDVAPIIEDVRSGVIRGVSVGYEVSQWRDGTGPQGRTRTAVKWKPRELSLVAVPADPNCQTRSTEMPDETPELRTRARSDINRQIRVLARNAGCATNVADDLIDREASIEDARQAVLDDVLARGRVAIRPSSHNETTLDNPEARARALSDALYTRIDPAFEPPGPARGYVGLTIPELARETLRRAGESVVGFSSATLVIRALHTTSDFANALGNTVGRTLRASYTAAPSSLKRLARETTAADFRAKSRILVDSGGLTLERVNEAGEFKAGTLVEAAESYRVETFGRIIGISRQALVNDDLGAFTDLSRRLGQAAVAFEDQFLFDLLRSQAGLGPVMSDGATLFDEDHGNIAETPSAPDVDGFSEARLAMRAQTGPGGGLINVVPAFVLVGPADETEVEKQLATLAAAKTDDVNPFSGKLTMLVEPRLGAYRNWYVVADPAQIDGLEYAYLAGAQGPQTETKAGFEVDGVQVKVRLDFGAGFVDWRGWYLNAWAPSGSP